MEIKLKPCPFCGRKPEFTRRGSGTSSDSYGFYKCYEIKCQNCGCTLNHTFRVEFEFNPSTGFSYDVNRLNAAVEEWNRRCRDDNSEISQQNTQQKPPKTE